MVMPMPPCSWIDCWPTNFADLPICTFAAATAVARSLASSKSARHGREHRHAAGLFDGDEHVGGAVLQGLEAADRHAELFSRLQIFDGGFQQFVHQADGLGAHRGARFVDHALDQRQAVLGIADHGIAPTSTPVKVMSAACRPSWVG